MKLLLDTHVAIWAVAYSPRLPTAIADLLRDSGNEIFVSVVTVWEIAIKRALGKRSTPPLSAEQAVGHFRTSGYRLLDVTVAHAVGVESLPPIHADPFDRLLVAQALAEPLRLLTRDTKVAAYSDSIIRF
jgi:PIN domain nuclease of toxin-antitoxin system